jgi:hypothetical protein
MLPTLKDRVLTSFGAGRVVGYETTPAGDPLVRVETDDGIGCTLGPSAVVRICESCDEPLAPPEDRDERVLTFCAACLHGEEL